MVELKEPFATLWRGKDPFEEVKTLQGEVFRELETRRTLRFEMAGKSYFLKWHRGTTLKEIMNWKLAVLCALKWRAKAIFSNGIAARP